MAENFGTPVSEPFELQVGDDWLHAERYGVAGTHAGWDNPNGITVVAANGNSVTPRLWTPFGKGLHRDGRERGLDMSLVTLEDGDYHDQASHTAAVTAAVRSVCDQVVDGHRIWIVGWSRGGISAVRAAGKDGHLAEEGLVDGVMTMATPTIPMKSIDKDSVRVPGLPAISPFALFSSVSMAEMNAQAEEYGLQLSIATHAMSRLAANRQAVVAEAAEVGATDISEELVLLSNYEGLQVVSVFYDHDTVVPAEPHYKGLMEAKAPSPDNAGFQKFGGVALRLTGTHFRALVGPVTRGVLLDNVEAAA